MLNRFSRPLAVLALGALAACGGPMSSSAIPSSGGTGTVTPPASGSILVGVGDSLTAGYQSEGLLGDTSPVTFSGTSLNPGSLYPGAVVPPGQESGWWSLMYQQMTGVANSEVPVMPLIKGPGLGSQLVISSSLFSSTHAGCDSFNAAAYSPAGWQSTRVNPSGTTLDLGVPGITMHEAITMKGPITGPPPAEVTTTTPPGFSCPGYPTIPGDITSGGLQSLVQGESLMFYPILGGFQSSLGTNLTELNAAVALKPQITTVWLGANDLLKFIFSGGQSPVTDTPTQMGADLTQIVTSLKATGSKVLVADLPNVLSTGQFFPQVTWSADLQSLGLPAAAANAIVAYVDATYMGGATSGGYLTESAFFGIVGTCTSTNPSVAANCLTPKLDPSGAGSGLGAAYLTPAFAAQVQALNTGYNQAIDAVAAGSGTGVALVPITTTFNAAAATGYTVAGTPFPPFTLKFGGGLLSWDGLHPSNTGYAVIANAFIGTADTAFGLTIPQLTPAQIANIAIKDPYDSYAIKTVNPAFPLPLP